MKRVRRWKTGEVLAELLAGKRMSEKYRITFEQVFGSLGKMYEEFPEKRVEVNKWLASLGGYADTTVRLWFTVLRLGCKYMEDNYELPNPCKGVETPRVLKKKRRYFRVDELRRILGACKDEYELALVMTLIDSSCRIGELGGLKVEDVGDGWIDVRGKTGEKRYRLDVRICEVLKRLNGDGGAIFGANGKALAMRVRRICKSAGLTGRKLGPHTLRHSSASLIASETKNVLAVKALLQHDVVTSSMVYIHDVEEELQKSLSPLGLVMERSGGVKQLPMEGSPDAYGNGEVEGEFVLEDDSCVVDGLVADMLPEIVEGISVRPMLRSGDLRLIRKGFERLVVSDDDDGIKASVLLKRILRKVR